MGFQGVEIDVYFDGEKSEFIVSHDLPYKKQKNGKLLNLKAVFEKFENLKFWLDLKNLNSSNQKKIIQRLNQLNQQFKIKGRILIESQNGRILRHLALEGYHSVFWILVNQKRKRYWLNELERRLLILMTPFAGVSMDYKQLMGPIGEMYRHLPIFTFTVNEKEDFEKWKAYQPRVVLTDKTNTWGK